jgi:hypothetical protein
VLASQAGLPGWQQEWPVQLRLMGAPVAAGAAAGAGDLHSRCMHCEVAKVMVPCDVLLGSCVASCMLREHKFVAVEFCCS